MNAFGDHDFVIKFSKAPLQYLMLVITIEGDDTSPIQILHTFLYDSNAAGLIHSFRENSWNKIRRSVYVFPYETHSERLVIIHTEYIDVAARFAVDFKNTSVFV